MMAPEVYCGDCLDILPTLEAESVQCCVTSPPYWGLRDYGTATWEGGDAGCEHRSPSRFDYPFNAGLGPTGIQYQTSNAGSGSVQQYRDVCAKCGARRIDSQLGLEPTPEAYVAKMVRVFREVWRVLRNDGTLWVNMGDSYAAGGGTYDMKSGTSTLTKPNKTSIMYCRAPTPAGLKPKDLCGIPWRLAFALQADGWYLRSDIIWSKPNPMPESVTDRPTKAHEYIFLLTKHERYFYDADAVAEPAEYRDYASWDERKANGEPMRRGFDAAMRPGNVSGLSPRNGKRNRRTVWTVATQPTFDVTLDFREADYVGRDGKPYKASADCPIHAHLVNRRSQQKAEGGEQLDRHDLRNLDTVARRASKRVAEHVSKISKHSELNCEGNICEHNLESTLGNKTCNGHPNESLTSDAEKSLRTNRIESLSMLPAYDSDSCRTDSEGFAISNSNQNHRTDHALETKLPCNASVQTASRTGDKSTLPEMPELFSHMRENNTLLGGSGVHLSAQKQSDILGKPSLRDTICQCKEYSNSHFATFPEDLVKPCIMAGSRLGDTVLDPFAGSGTTGKVAIELGRRAVLIELNPAYVDLINDRTNVTAGML